MSLFYVLPWSSDNGAFELVTTVILVSDSTKKPPLFSKRKSCLCKVNQVASTNAIRIIGTFKVNTMSVKFFTLWLFARGIRDTT